MIKALFVSAAIFAAPASANAMEPVDALMGLIRMETARQFCDLAPDQGAINELVNVVAPHVKVSPESFVQSVRNAAASMGAEYARNGSLPGFCANVGRIYGRYGK